MIHRMDIYTATNAQDAAGGDDPSYTLAHENVPCRVQEATSEVIDQYNRNDEKVILSIYLVNQTAYDLVNTESRIVYDSVNYEKIGGKNLSRLNRVFRIDVIKEIQ
jgi:hypothetical protein